MGFSLKDAVRLDWETVVVMPDDRMDYGELREVTGWSVTVSIASCLSGMTTPCASSVSARQIAGRCYDMSSNIKVKMPTLEEDAAINLGIASDPDTLEVSDSEFVNLKPLWVAEHRKTVSTPALVCPNSVPFVMPVAG
ncbi:MAG: hypothetical protein H7838_10195 [Magnetococcus sp. DMHC-8]